MKGTFSEDVDQKQIFEEYSKKEKSSQSLGGLSFGAPTFEAFDSREVSVRPRFVEERPPSIYSTTVPTIFEEAEEPLRLPPTIPCMVYQIIFPGAQKGMFRTTDSVGRIITRLST